MESEWKMTTLGDVSIDVAYGYTESANKQNVGPKFLRITDIQGGSVDWSTVPFCPITTKDYKKYKLQKGDIVVARTGNSTGENYLFKDDIEAVFASYLIRFRINSPNVDPLFVWYTMRSNDWNNYVRGAKTGSAQAGANATVLSKFSFNLPPLFEQKRIARILSSLDDKIELNNQMNRTLEEMAQAIFKSWFVNFEPVKAKIRALETGTQEDAEIAAMQAISGKTEEKLAQLKIDAPKNYAQLSHTASLFPSSLQDSELGEIPVGWEVKALDEFGKIICGKTPSKQRQEFFGEDIPFIKIPDMHNQMFAVSTNEKLSNEGAESQKNKILPPNSICVSCIATVGKVIITVTKSQTNQQINSIIVNKPSYTPYLYFYMLSKERHLHDLASGGSATLNMNTSTFSSIQAISPSEIILDCFELTTRKIFENIQNLIKECRNLSKTRDTLIPKLLSGEISVAEANKEMDEVTNE